MHLKVGETYNFFKNIKDWWIIKILKFKMKAITQGRSIKTCWWRFNLSMKVKLVISVSARFNVYYLRNNKIS
jgi:hypothetical protein